MRCLGVDLGWVSGASGLCCLEWEAGQLKLLDLRCHSAIADILAWVDHWAAAPGAAMIAVDAPTLIPNATGMREPDRLTHRHFGRYHAGCYPANLGRPFAQRTVEFGRSLEARGFQHAPAIAPQQPGRFQIEVFPHPAMVHLFGLSRILKYKKGTLAERRAGLMQLLHHVHTHLPLKEPALPTNTLAQWIPEIPPRNPALKATEDQLDSLICAYVAAHWWYWGQERNWVLGDRNQGYIVVPAPPRVTPP